MSLKRSSPAASRAIPIILLINVVAVAGCGGPVPNSAGALSKAGQAASSAAGQAAVASANQFAAYQDVDIFLHGFVGGPPKDPKLVALESANEAELTSRAALFSSLGKAYSALGNLAGNDASGDFQSSLSDLFSSINAYQAAVKQGPINADVTSLVSPAAGALAGLVQTKLVLAASDQIRTQLRNVINIMSDPLVREQFVSQKQMIVSELDRNAVLLMGRGLLSPKPYFEALGAPMGLGASADFAARLASDKMASRGIAALVAARQTAASALVPASYDTSLAALKDLVPLHDKLQAGQPLDLFEIDQVVQKLQAIAAAAQANKGKAQ